MFVVTQDFVKISKKNHMKSRTFWFVGELNMGGGGGSVNGMLYLPHPFSTEFIHQYDCMT